MLEKLRPAEVCQGSKQSKEVMDHIEEVIRRAPKPFDAQRSEGLHQDHDIELSKVLDVANRNMENTRKKGEGIEKSKDKNNKED